MGESFLENYLSTQSGIEPGDGGLEAVIQKEKPKKTFSEAALSASDFLKNHYNALVAAGICGSYALSMALEYGSPEITFGVLLASAISYMAFQKRNHFSKSLKKSSAGKISSFLKEHCFTIGIGSAGIMAAGAYKNILLDRAMAAYSGEGQIPALKNFIGGQYLKKDLAVASTALCMGLLYSSAIKIISSFNAEKKNSWKYLVKEAGLELKSSRESLENLAEIEEKKISRGDASRNSYLLLANSKMELGLEDDAFYFYSRVLESSETGIKADVINNPITSRLIIKPITRLIHPDRQLRDENPLAYSIEHAFSDYYGSRDISSSLKNWEAALALSSGETKAKLLGLYSMFLSEAGKRALSEEKAGELAAWLKEGKLLEKSLYEVPSSRNEVFTFGSGFFRDSMILKRNKGINPAEEEARIVSEYITSGFITEIFRNKIETDFRNIAPIPIAVFRDENGRVYHLMKKSAGLNLRDYFENCSETEKAAALKRVMESSALIHAYAIDFLEKENDNYYIKFAEGNKLYGALVPKLDFSSALEKRLVLRLGESMLSEALIKEAEDYFHSVAEIYAFCHGDSYITNFLEDGSWIDLEKRAIANPLVDIAGLLECPELKDFPKENLVSSYCSTFSRYKNNKNLKDRLISSYPAIRIFNSLCQIGSKTAQENPIDALFFTSSALEELERQGVKNLEDILYRYIKSTKPEYLRFSGQ